jgi:hypothetical protein
MLDVVSKIRIPPPEAPKPATATTQETAIINQSGVVIDVELDHNLSKATTTLGTMEKRPKEKTKANTPIFPTGETNVNIQSATPEVPAWIKTQKQLEKDQISGIGLPALESHDAPSTSTYLNSSSGSDCKSFTKHELIHYFRSKTLRESTQGTNVSPRTSRRTSPPRNFNFTSFRTRNHRSLWDHGPMWRQANSSCERH